MPTPPKAPRARKEPAVPFADKPKKLRKHIRRQDQPGYRQLVKTSKTEIGGIRYSDDIAKIICRRIAMGEPLKQVCRSPNMPAHGSVYDWLASGKHLDFNEMFNEACAMRSEGMADEILEIADNSTNDWIERETKEGRIVKEVDHDHINRSRLMVETRKWLMGKLSPKRYGDKAELNLTGKNGGPIQLTAVPPTAEEASKSYLEMVNGDNKRGE